MPKEYVERGALLKEFDEYEPGEWYENEQAVWLDLRLAVINEPAADVVEVVRCKECKHWDKGYNFCKLHGVDCLGNSFFGEKGFCSYGEKKNAE